MCIVYNWVTFLHGRNKPNIVNRLCMCAQGLSRVWLFQIPWTVARQTPLSVGFSRQEYCSGVTCPLQGIFPTSPVSPALSGRFFTTEPPGKPCFYLKNFLKMSAWLYSFKSSRKSISLSFQLLEATCILWPINHSSVLKASNTGSSPSHVAISLVLSLPPLSSIFKDPYD